MDAFLLDENCLLNLRLPYTTFIIMLTMRLQNKLRTSDDSSQGASNFYSEGLVSFPAQSTCLTSIILMQAVANLLALRENVSIVPTSLHMPLPLHLLRNIQYHQIDY